MADGQVALEGRQLALVEGVGDQAHVLDDGDGVAVADRHASRLLAAVLQGVEAEVGQLGDGVAGGVDPEDAAGLLGVLDLTAHRTARPPARGARHGRVSVLHNPSSRGDRPTSGGGR